MTQIGEEPYLALPVLTRPTLPPARAMAALPV